MALIACPRLPHRLRLRFPDQRTPSYREVYQRLVDGTIPHEIIGNRLYVDERHEHLVAEAFGLTDRKSSEIATAA